MESVAAYPYIDNEFAETLANSAAFSYKGFNYYKDMLEKLNISFVFNLDPDYNILIDRSLLEKSVLNGYNGDKDLLLKGYADNKSLMDNFDDFISTNYSFDIEEDEDNLVLIITGDLTNIKSIAITNNGKNLLIVNNVQVNKVDNILKIYI